jgi:hypothetical protein
MKYTIKNAMLYAAVASLFSGTLSGMESEDKVRILPNSAQALSFLLKEKQYLFDHKMICAVGGVCKGFDQVCRETAPQRKKFINGFVNFSMAVKISEAWHKYGSAYGYIDKNVDVGKPDLQFCLKCTKLQCKGEVSFRSQMYQQKAELVEGFNLPKFNENGDAYSFYKYPPENKIVELSLSESCSFYRTCGLRYMLWQDVYIYPIYGCAGFPDLLKAFLNSSSGEEVIEEERWKLFNLHDAIIPDDYYYSSIALPEILYHAIAQLHQEQQQPKEKKIPSFLPMALVEFITLPSLVVKKQEREQKRSKK